MECKIAMRFFLPVSILFGWCAPSGAEIGASHRTLKMVFHQQTQAEKDSAGAQNLFKAIQQENLPQVKAVLKANSHDILEAALGNHDLITPLHLAVIVGNQDIVKVLLDAGSNPDSKNLNGATPVHMAAQLAEEQILLELIKAQGNVNARTTSAQETPLHIAAVHDTPTIIDILLAAGADIDAVDAEGETPLHEAAAYGSQLSASLLLEHGANPGLRDRKGRLPKDFICFCLTYVGDLVLIQCGQEQCNASDIELLEDLLEEVSLMAPEPEFE